MVGDHCEQRDRTAQKQSRHKAVYEVISDIDGNLLAKQGLRVKREQTL